MKKTYLFIVGFLIFAALSFYSYSEVCCMFSSTKYFGWPYSYLVLNKTTDDYSEALRIKTESIPSLINGGWKWRFSTHMTKGFLGSPIFSLAANLLFSFFTAYALICLIGFLKKISK
jgi:hypothetical protein